jgi:Potential Queuosine, Q, salvage protein family
VAIVDEIRGACAEVAAASEHVRIDEEALHAYADSLPPIGPISLDPETHYLDGTAEDTAAFVLTLDAINFGSGWFPTIRRRAGLSGYFTVASGLKGRFERSGRWPAQELATLTAGEIAAVLGQHPRHELMRLYAEALRSLGRRIADCFEGRFGAVVDAAAGSAVALVELLASWPSFRDRVSYAGRTVPFFKRAQITASDLAAAGIASFSDLHRLTLFADNLVPHVLHVDGVLRYERQLARRIRDGEQLAHGSAEEVEIRACALHAVELLAHRSGASARELDNLLWNRGQQPRYKARPRHRCRCTAY